MAENTPSIDLPTDLSAMDSAALDEALASARAEAEALQGTDPADLTDEQVTRLEALADFADTVTAERTARAEAAAARAERAAAAGQRLAADPGDGEPTEGDDDEEVEAPVEEPATVEAPVEQPEAVAAGGARRPVPAPARRRQPAPAPARATSPMTLVAGAGLPNIESGHEMQTMREVAEAFIARSKGFPSRATGTPQRHAFNIIQARRQFADGLQVGNPDFADAQAAFQEAARESRLADGSLVAAGGWCAPSETRYDLAAPETLDGIIDLPTVGVDRGGINYTPGPDFADIFATAGFVQTEAEAIAGEEKNCVEIDCPDFAEVRLDAVGVCVKAPLLTRAAYPELVERWLTGTFTANAHKVAARLIASMRTALGTPLAPTLTGTPITWSTLTALELVGEGQRQAYRLGEGQTLEVVAPRWLRVAIRGDLANRPGYPQEPSQVTNEMIDQHFAVRGMRVQWVLNYLEIANPLTNVAFPATAEVMVYPAGTFVKGTADVINLDTLYDSTDLVQNIFTAAFVEDGVLLAKMQHGGKRITLPVNVSGMVGAAQMDDSWGTAQVENAGAAAA